MLSDEVRLLNISVSVERGRRCVFVGVGFFFLMFCDIIVIALLGISPRSHAGKSGHLQPPFLQLHEKMESKAISI